MLAAGDIVGDRYEVEGLAGRGGMAVVYRVRHRGLGSVHALKILAMKQKGLSRRLQQEGEIQARLRHPNIVQVTDLVEHDGQVGLVMEFIESPPLDDWLATNGPMTVDDALSVFVPVVSAVAAAHDIGVLHRDIKPGNIMLAKGLGGFVPKVSDFGIAKMVLDDAPSRTVGGMPMGTPGFMAPEQIRDAKGVDARCDQFALAAVLYTMLTGTAPYDHEDPFEAMEATLAGSHRPVSEAAPDVPPDVALAIERALSTDREARFPELRSFGLALLGGHPELLPLMQTATGAPFRVARSTTGSLAPRGKDTFQPPSSPTAVPLTKSGTTLATPSPPVRNSLGIAAAGAIGLLALVGVVGVAAAAAAGLFLLPGATPESVREPVVSPAPPPSPVEVAQPPIAAPDPEPGPIVAPPALPAPGARPTPVPSATEVPEPAVVPPEPSPEPAAAPEPEAVAVAPDPIPEPAPEAPAWPGVLGRDWVGKANGQAFRLRFTRQTDARVNAVATFQTGPTVKKTTMGGTLGLDGSLTLTSDESPPVKIVGRLVGGEFRGEYSLSGGKMLPWNAQ